jgi:hypothetical protein
MEVNMAMKTTFYCVMSEFYDDGGVHSAMISRECREKPKDTFKSLPRIDAYNDWFESREEAEAFLAEARAEGKKQGAA